MYDADRPLTLLFLVSVLQPVAVGRLRKEYANAVRKDKKNSHSNTPSFSSALNDLHRSRLVSKQRGLCRVTRLGFQKISTFGLNRIRDKNRLFLLKKVL